MLIYLTVPPPTHQILSSVRTSVLSKYMHTHTQAYTRHIMLYVNTLCVDT